MNVKQFRDATGLSIYEIARRANVAYTTLHGHVAHDRPVGLKVAKKLEAVVVDGCDARMTAIEILNLQKTDARSPRRRARKEP